MNARREAMELRDLADALLAIEERARSLRRLPVSDDTEDMLDRIAGRLAQDADALQLQADMLAPQPFMPTLFQWARGKAVLAVTP